MDALAFLSFSHNNNHTRSSCEQRGMFHVFLRASTQANVCYGIHMALRCCELSHGGDEHKDEEMSASSSARIVARTHLRFRRVVQACWTAASVQDALFVATFSTLHELDMKAAPRHIQRYLWETIGFSKDVFHTTFALARRDSCTSWMDALLASDTPQAAAVLVLALRLLHAIADRDLATCPLLGLMRMFEMMQRTHRRTLHAVDAMYNLGFMRFPILQPTAHVVAHRLQDRTDVTARLTGLPMYVPVGPHKDNETEEKGSATAV